MAKQQGVMISVRGEAQATVAPDSVVLTGAIATWGASKAEALSLAAVALDHLTTELAALGGVALGAGTERSTLTWSASSTTTHPERQHEKSTGRHELTGRIVARVEVRVAVREFALLDALGSAMARQEGFDVRQITWGVDDDNPAWAAVRSEAIAAALRKARDYATALGASLLGVEHVADTGLLGGSEEPRRVRAVAMTAMSSGGPGGEHVDTPTLDPVPQVLSAVIEARLRATPAILPD